MPSVAITGATGFIGGRLLAVLLASGWQCRVLVRGHRTRDWPPGVVPVVGSLKDREALKTLLDGVDAVVHCAGRVRGATLRAFRRDNTEGTAVLAEIAAQRLSPPYLLMLSSLAAREPGLSAYATSKREAERCLSLASEQLRWTVLRPPAVYGPGDREMLPLLRTLLAGLGPVVSAPGARISLIHVDDLVAALMACLERHPAGLFELHDGRPGGYSWAEILTIAAAVRGRPVYRLPVPGWLLAALGRVNLLIAAVLGRSPMLSPGKVRELRHPDWVCDNAAFTAASDWLPSIGLEDGLRRLRQQLNGTPLA